MRQRLSGKKRGRFDGIKLLPFGLLFLLAIFARAFRGFGRDLTLDNGMLVIVIALLLGILLVGAAALITHLRK